MKGKFSLNTLFHNDRLMIGASFAAAIVIWALVSFGPANVMTRTITTQVTVDLADTAAGYNDLRVIGKNTFTVNVVVEGTRSTIFNLNGDDIEVKASLSDIQGAGTAELPLIASQSGKTNAYSISSISPNTVTVSCDYWTTAEFPLATDISKVSVQDEGKQQLGDVIVDTTTLDGNNVRLEGPVTIVNKIDSIIARVDDTGTIGKTTRFSAGLLALDADGNSVDISSCTFLVPNATTIDLTIPVWVQKKVDLTYTLANVPKGISQTNLITLSQKAVTLVGEEDVLEKIASSIGNLGTFDFDHLTPEDKEMTITLNVPSTVRVLEDTVVTVKLNIGSYKKKTLSYSVRNLSDVTVENLPDGKTITLQEQKLTEITLYGSAASIRKVTAADLVLKLDAASNTGTGSVRYSVRVSVPKYPDIWVYYGTDDTNGYKLYGTLS